MSSAANTSTGAAETTAAQQYAVGDLVQICSDVERMKVSVGDVERMKVGVGDVERMKVGLGDVERMKLGVSDGETMTVACRRRQRPDERHR